MATASGCFVDRSGIEVLDGNPRSGCAVPCENGGVCLGSECFCGAVDYSGPTCSDMIDDCADVECEEGTCFDRVREHACNCNPGWTIGPGGRCTVEIVSCSTPNACVRGTCNDSAGAVVCECYPGYQGTNCNVPVNCGSPPSPPKNSTTDDITGTEFGDVVTFDCLPGFGSDSVAVMCQANASWEVPNLSCKASDCGPPELEQYTFVSIPDGTKVGALATYWCASNFSLYGTATRVCQEDGDWSGSAPRCVLNGTCANDPCVFGTCVDFNPNGVVCWCTEGWTGALCSVDATQ